MRGRTDLPTDLPPHIVSYAKGEKADEAANQMPVGQTLDEFIQQQERGYIEATLRHCGGSREKAASMLGISMATLYRKVEPKEKVEPLQVRFVYILIWLAAFCSSSNVSSAVFCLFKISSFAALKSRSALRLLAVVSVAVAIADAGA